MRKLTFSLLSAVTPIPFNAEDFSNTEVQEPIHITTLTASVARFRTTNMSNHDLDTGYIRIADYTTSERRGCKLELGGGVAYK